jgi:orotidine-5'-phosphate decarboxylase
MIRVSGLPSFRKRIKRSSRLKNSRIILSLDLPPMPELKKFALMSIFRLQQHICAIKVNFHLILPFSKSDLTELNYLAHSYGLESIADIKLNDIASTNQIAIQHLLEMGFDSVIVNPFMGKDSLKSAVEQTHEKNCGVIALVYMSHPRAGECYGADIVNSKKNRTISMYKLFHNMAIDTGVDGIVVGATHIDVIRDISKVKRIPIYSPGVGVQGGDICLTKKHGADFFIVGRSILTSGNPLRAVRKYQRLTSSM